MGFFFFFFITENRKIPILKIEMMLLEELEDSYPETPKTLPTDIRVQNSSEK